MVRLPLTLNPTGNPVHLTHARGYLYLANPLAYSCNLGYSMQVMVRLPLTLNPTGNPVHLTHARGYLYIATPTGVAVFNTTGYGLRRPPKMVSAHSLGSIAAAFTADDNLVSYCWLPQHETYLCLTKECWDPNKPVSSYLATMCSL